MQKYDTHFSCGNIYFGKNYPYFGSYGSLFGLLPYLLIGGSMSLPKREREGNLTVLPSTLTNVIGHYA